MSTVSAEHTNESPETERHATAHTAVLLPRYREETRLNTGLIPAMRVLRNAHNDGTTYVNMGVACREHMRLAAELPFYEVAFEGKVYRLLARPVPGQQTGRWGSGVKYEFVRTRAPGLCVDGWFMDPPNDVPNTPRSLVEELQAALGAAFTDLENFLANAYSIFHYRLAHEGRYPTTMEPQGYAFGELFLMSADSEGTLSTLYETPKGTNVELWTMFLRILDGKSTKLVDYVNSSMAVREFGEAGAANLHEALRRRDGHSRSTLAMTNKRFLEVFPPSAHTTVVKRDVGRHSWMF